MNKYLEDLKSMEIVGTSYHKQEIPDITVIKEVSAEAPETTSVDQTIYTEEICQSSVPYSAPQKVIVRTYRLRK